MNKYVIIIVESLYSFRDSGCKFILVKSFFNIVFCFGLVVMLLFNALIYEQEIGRQKKHTTPKNTIVDFKIDA